jgi:hypothetical protein
MHTCRVKSIMYKNFFVMLILFFTLSCSLIAVWIFFLNIYYSLNRSFYYQHGAVARACLWPTNIYNSSWCFWAPNMGQTMILLKNIFCAYSWVHLECMLPHHIALVKFSFLTLFISILSLSFYKSLGIYCEF